jgi:hypothetical protein
VNSPIKSILLFGLSLTLSHSPEVPPARQADRERSRDAFAYVYKVLEHPRCRNCHPAGDAPLQGDDGRPHAFRIQRGSDGTGILSAKCANCHQAQNLPGEHLPPGAPFPDSDAAHRGEPRWRLPSSKHRLIFQGRTPAQLCRQLLDRRHNGGLDRAQLLEHVESDTFVLWAWNPGEGRTAPPGGHAAFVARMREWLDNGAACP